MLWMADGRELRSWVSERPRALLSHGTCIAPGEPAASGTIAFNLCGMMVIGEHRAGLTGLQLQAFENRCDAASFSQCFFFFQEDQRARLGKKLALKVPERATTRV